MEMGNDWMVKICVQCGKPFTKNDLATPHNFKRQVRCSAACMHASKKYTPEQAAAAFWRRVDKNGPNGCWVWQGYCQRFGHGWLGHRGLAHRYAWELLRGPLPQGKCLLHHCDNPPCVNPDHLYIGDRRDNTRDRVKRGRHARGEATRRNKLTAEQVQEIRARFRKEGGRRQSRSNARELAAEYDVTTLAVNAIIAGRTWRHLL